MAMRIHEKLAFRDNLIKQQYLSSFEIKFANLFITCVDIFVIYETIIIVVLLLAIACPKLETLELQFR